MNEASFNAASQLTQMRQEIMDSLRAELQSQLQFGLQSRVEQLENECKLLHEENSELKRECKILKKQVLRNEAKISQLQGEANKAEREAKYNNMVTKYKNWEYPQDVPTYDELLSLGYDDDDDEYRSTEYLDTINHMKHLTIKMRRGETCSPTVECPGELYSRYHEEMLPHYEEFANALDNYRYTIDYMEETTFGFSLGYAELPKEVLDILHDALQNTHFHNLIFNHNVLDGVGYIHFIASCVAANTRLKCLTLSQVTFDRTSRYIDALCTAVNNHDSLQHLALEHCAGDFRGIFNKLKSSTLTVIDLRSNGISNLRPEDMSDFLSSNPSLRELNLPYNPFNEQDIVYIADALRNNSSLKDIMFAFHLLPHNWHLLASIVFDQTSLNSAYDSNHHCHLHLEGSRAAISEFNKYKDHTLNRRKKIYNILSIRNRNRENAAHFESDDIGMKHMPQILALLKPFSEHCLDNNGSREEAEVEPLSIAYEIMRDWKMPELYNLDVMEED